MDILNETLNTKGDSKKCPVIFLFKDDKLLIGLRNYTPDKWKTVSVWTVPGGRCDEGELLGETLKREVVEETGIENFEITNYLGEVPGAKEGDAIFVFTGKTNEEPKLIEPEKFSEWKWSILSQIPDNFINPESLALVKSKTTPTL